MEQSKATGKVKDYPLNESTIQHQLDRLAKTHPNNREELLDTLTAHDMLKRFHHQLRAEYYWSTLINVNTKRILPLSSLANRHLEVRNTFSPNDKRFNSR